MGRILQKLALEIPTLHADDDRDLRSRMTTGKSRHARTIPVLPDVVPADVGCLFAQHRETGSAGRCCPLACADSDGRRSLSGRRAEPTLQMRPLDYWLHYR